MMIESCYLWWVALALPMIYGALTRLTRARLRRAGNANRSLFNTWHIHMEF